MEAAAAVVGGDVQVRNLRALIQKIQPFGATRAGEHLGVAEVAGDLIHRRQPRAAGDRHNPRARGRCDGDAVGAAHIGGAARRQVHQRVGETAHVDDDQGEGRVQQGGEGLFADTGNPQMDEFAGPNGDAPIEGEQGDVGTHPLIRYQGDRFEAHIHVVAEHGLGARARVVEIRC